MATLRILPLFLLALAARSTTANVVQQRNLHELQKRQAENPLTGVVDQLSLAVQQLQAKVTALEDRLEAQSVGNPGSGQKAGVAFMAQYSVDNAIGVSQGPYIFDNAILNVGDAYDPSSGIFTAPVSGIYVLALQLFTDDSGVNEHPFVDIKVNGNTLARMAFDEGDGQEDSDSATVTARLREGDRVWVASEEGKEYHYWGMFHSFFTGTLVTALPDEPMATTMGQEFVLPSSTTPPF